MTKVFCYHKEIMNFKNSECHLKSNLKPSLKYPLTDKEALYQLEYKKYTGIDMFKYKSNFDFTKLKNLIPNEKDCKYCNEELSGPIEYCKSSIILDLKSILTQVKLFLKICRNCKIRYFYKETSDGIHVSDTNSLY